MIDMTQSVDVAPPDIDPVLERPAHALTPSADGLLHELAGGGAGQVRPVASGLAGNAAVGRHPVCRSDVARVGVPGVHVDDACFAPDAVWHLPGKSVIAGEHRGWPAIRDGVLAKLGPLSGHTFRAELLDIAVSR